MKKIYIAFTILILLFFAAGILYLLNRPSDYQAHFTVKTTRDIVYYNLHNWDFWNRNHLNAEIEILNTVPVSSISQKVTLQDTTLIFKWEFEKLNDSSTLVRVFVSDPERKVYNRLTIPFRNTTFRKSVRRNLIDIITRMESLLKTFKYEFKGIYHFDKRACVYISLNCSIRDKARTMIANVAELNQFVRQNKLGLNGSPFLVIHDWHDSNDSIKFDFCFPIADTNNIPEHPKIKFMTVDDMNALKTDFFGNYGISDITWYDLKEEAEKMGYRSNNKIIEVYRNDPHNGGNELEWKAEIYLGIGSFE
ncbi:MAG TPA: GyrI-like domain-containing protein [Bacteroidales bacterium]|nr:GyrI-like domain-containing protein [Bacteroidales bacterium]